MIDFDTNIFENKIKEIDTKNKRAPFENHPLNIVDSQMVDMYLTLLCAVGKFGDEPVTSNDYIIKIVSSVDNIKPIEQYLDKTSKIDREFVNVLIDLFTENSIKYNLYLDMLMVKGTTAITEVANDSKSTKFISDMAMLLKIEDDKKTLLDTLSENFLDTVKKGDCVDILNSLCKTIDYTKYFKCYIKEYNIQEVIIEKDIETIIIKTIMGCEITFDFYEFTVNGIENHFKDWGKVVLQNAKLDVSKCHFSFNETGYQDIEFKYCEFYSSSILNDTIFLCNQCDLTFEECSFHDIKFNINSNSDLIVGKGFLDIDKCSFNRIYDFNSIINWYSNRYDRSNLLDKYFNLYDRSSTINGTTFNDLEGNLIFGNEVLNVHHIKVENSILNNISSNGDDIGDRDSKFEYTTPKNKKIKT